MPHPTSAQQEWRHWPLLSDPQDCDTSSEDGSQYLDKYDDSSDVEMQLFDDNEYDDSPDNEVESTEEPVVASEERNQSLDKDDDMSDVDSDDLSDYSSEDPRDYLDEDGFLREDLRDDSGDGSEEGFYRDDRFPSLLPELILSDEGSSIDQIWYPDPAPEEQE